MSKRTLATVSGVVIASEAVLIVTDTGPNIWLVAALVGFVCVAVRFMTAIDAFVARPEAAPRPATAPTSYPDLRTTALRQALAVGNSDARHGRRLHEQLVAIVDDELRSAHGIDRNTEPDAARAVLGDELDRFVTDPRPGATLTPRGVTRIVTLIEQL